MASANGSFAIPLLSIRFDETYFQEWGVHLRIHLNDRRLLGHLSSEHPCLSRPTSLVLSALSVGVDQAAQEVATAALEEALELYQSEMHAYERWQDVEAHATAILVGSLPVVIFMDMVELPTTQLMFGAHYQLMSDAMYLSIVHQARSLQQLNATVDDFYQQLYKLWHQLDSLGSDVY